MFTPKLTYLFVAEFTDGTFLKQTPEDRSSLDPEKRSQFYDVLQSGKQLRRFSLVGKGNTLTVDLKNGIFYVNGLPLLIESERLPTVPDKFELIYYRQVTQNINVTYEVGSGKIRDTDSETGFSEYFIGWQCQIKGKEYQQKIAVS